MIDEQKKYFDESRLMHATIQEEKNKELTNLKKGLVVEFRSILMGQAAIAAAFASFSITLFGPGITIEINEAALSAGIILLALTVLLSITKLMSVMASESEDLIKAKEDLRPIDLRWHADHDLNEGKITFDQWLSGEKEFIAWVKELREQHRKQKPIRNDRVVDIINSIMALGVLSVIFSFLLPHTSRPAWNLLVFIKEILWW